MLICRARLPKDRRSAIRCSPSSFFCLQPSPSLIFGTRLGLLHAGTPIKRRLPTSSQLFGCGIVSQCALLPCCWRCSTGQLQDHQEIHQLLGLLEERGIATLVAPRDTFVILDTLEAANKREHVPNKVCDKPGHDGDFGR